MPHSLTSAGHVTVPANQLPNTFGQQGWPPTEEDIRACELAIAHDLKKSGHELGSYYLRLAGVVRDGRRHILGMAANRAEPNSADYLRPASEDHLFMAPFGGGDLFFRFDYDTQRRRLVKLEFNRPL
jgi:hypothetical protein